MPVVWLHVPTSWHWSLAAQTTGFDPVQVPFWQVSVCVHALLSLQAVPLLAFDVEQAPAFGSQTATWHESEGVQVNESHGCAIRATFSSWIDQVAVLAGIDGVWILKKRAVWVGKLIVTTWLVPVPVAMAFPKFVPSFDTNTE